MILKKEKGTSTIPFLGFFLIFSILLVSILVCYMMAVDTVNETEDAITVTLQSVCLMDRYEFSNSSSGVPFTCFYPGTTYHYSMSDDSINLFSTIAACNIACDRFRSILLTNLPQSKFIKVTLDASDSNKITAECIDEFCMTNIHGKAYVHDSIKGYSLIQTAEDTKSTISLKINITFDFPIFGEMTLPFTVNGKIELY